MTITYHKTQGIANLRFTTEHLLISIIIFSGKIMVIKFSLQESW